MLKIRRNRKSRSKDNLFIVLWNFLLRNRNQLKKKKGNRTKMKEKVKTMKMIMKRMILSKMKRNRKNIQIKKVNYLIYLSCNMKKNIQRKLRIMNPLIEKKQKGKKMIAHLLKEDPQDQVSTIIMVRINGKRNKIEVVLLVFTLKEKMITKRKTRNLHNSSNHHQEQTLSHKVDKELTIILNKRSSHCSTVIKYFVCIF